MKHALLDHQIHHFFLLGERHVVDQYPRQGGQAHLVTGEGGQAHLVSGEGGQAHLVSGEGGQALSVLRGQSQRSTQDRKQVRRS